MNPEGLKNGLTAHQGMDDWHICRVHAKFFASTTVALLALLSTDLNGLFVVR